MGQSHGTITPQWDYPNNDIDQPSWHLLKWDNMFINQSCQPPWQLRTLQSDKGEIILQDQMIGKNKKVAHFCPPSKKEVYPNHQPWKNHQKSALVQIPPANTVFRENIIHISTDQGRAKPWPMEKIYSQRTMFKSSKEINIKNLSPSGQKCVCSKESTCIFDRSWDKKGFASHVVRVRRNPNPNLIAEILMTHTTRLVLAKMKTTKQTSVLDFHWLRRILVWFQSGILMSSGGSHVGP